MESLQNLVIIQNGEDNAQENGPDDILKSVTVYLEDELKLDVIKTDSCGVFGDVLVSKIPGGNEELTVRIVLNHNVCMKELTEWPRLKHKNLLTLLRAVHVPELDLHLFISQKHPHCLESVLSNETAFNRTESLNYVQKWLREMLSGLHYLHQKNLCHLGLHMKNVMISNGFSAIISNFKTLNAAKDFTDRYDVPDEYRSPEAYRLPEKSEVDGIAFDLWCFGMLALDVFTFRCKSKKVFYEEPSCWFQDVYPVAMKMLQRTDFKDSCRRSFPECSVDKQTLKHMRNFLTTCLRHRPEDRPSAQKLMEHRYLEKNGWVSKPDDLWENKAPISHVRRQRSQRIYHWLKKFGRRSWSRMAAARQYMNNVAQRISTLARNH